MRIASIYINGTRRFGRAEGATFTPIGHGQDPLDLLSAGAEAELEWDAPVPYDPTGVLEPPLPISTLRDFITFEQHTAGSLRAVTGSTEVPDAWFEAPTFYFTNPYAAVGSGHEVIVPPGCEVYDFELEVAAVIGADGFNLTVDEAWEHIAGFTILNDWSARDLQQREMRVGLGPVKGKDTATTLGPTIVTKDELAEYFSGGHYGLEMQVFVNGELIGGDSLGNMAWTFAELVAYASRGTWVRRGDVLGSGTSGGGCLAELWGWNGSHEPAPLAVGDTVTMTVQGLGSISNRVVAGPPLHPVPAARRVPWAQPPGR